MKVLEEWYKPWFKGLSPQQEIWAHLSWSRGMLQKPVEQGSKTFPAGFVWTGKRIQLNCQLCAIIWRVKQFFICSSSFRDDSNLICNFWIRLLGQINEPMGSVLKGLDSGNQINRWPLQMKSLVIPREEKLVISNVGAWDCRKHSPNSLGSMKWLGSVIKILVYITVVSLRLLIEGSSDQIQKEGSDTTSNQTSLSCFFKWEVE